ncbi:MAG: hypothetical protein M1363_02505 [Gammaproteobacteria bacterium]|nr:hypothetical protein [Gammaproteobacteria bacterium]
MAKALILLLIIVAGFIVGPLLSGQTGYVLIAIAGYTLETSLVVLALSILLVIFLLWLIEWLVRKISGGTRMSMRWSRRRKARKARQLMNNACNHLLTANYEQAQRDAEDAAHYTTDKEQAYLIAALAAEQHGDVVAKQSLLQKAAAERDEQSLALQLHHAKRAAPATAVTNAKNLLQQYPDHIGVKRIAAEIFYQYQQWQPLFELLPLLDKHELVDAERLHQYRVFVYEAYFAAASPSIEKLHRSWQDLPKKERLRAVPRVAYASALQQSGHYGASEKVILQGLRKNSLSASHLIHPSSTLNWQQQGELSEFIQGHVKQAPNDADALTLLGSVALQQGDQDLAQRALRHAIQIQPSADRYRLLGDAYLASGQSQPALDAYREAAQP